MAGALSRIARRIAQGFTRPAYHGTRSAEILDDVLKLGEGTADRMLGPHFAADPRAYIVTDPSAVRSWFAKFDPDKSGRAGLGFASGGLAKAASLVSPDLGRIYEESVEFGRQFPRASGDGPGDAARHAYAASRLARRYGPGATRLIGGLYEMLSLGSDRRSTRMDEYNNEAGIGLAELEDAAARAKIREMIERNQLETLPAGTGGGY